MITGVLTGVTFVNLTSQVVTIHRKMKCQNILVLYKAPSRDTGVKQ